MDRNLFQQIDFTYIIRLINPINDYLDVAFYAMFGKHQLIKELQVIFFHREMKDLLFNLLLNQGITFNYNFNQFLKKDHIIEPTFI